MCDVKKKILKPCCYCSRRKNKKKEKQCDLHSKNSLDAMSNTLNHEAEKALDNCNPFSHYPLLTLALFVTRLCSYDLLALVKCSEATDAMWRLFTHPTGPFTGERETPRAEPRQLSNDSISYTDGSKWHPEISTHSLSMHYIRSPYFRYCFVMVMHVRIL